MNEKTRIFKGWDGQHYYLNCIGERKFVKPVNYSSHLSSPGSYVDVVRNPHSYFNNTFVQSGYNPAPMKYYKK